MEMGFKTRCYPTKEQAIILSRWIGCQRFIKNSKVGEWAYFRSLSKLSGERTQPDQQFSQFHSDGTAFLKEVPSQILRNGAYLWMRTMQKAFRGECGFPKLRKKSQKESVLITKELFSFEERECGFVTLSLGTQKFPVGALSFKRHRQFKVPSSIVITREKSGPWSLSFCFVADDIPEPDRDKNLVESYDLDKIIESFDRGVVTPMAGTKRDYDFSPEQKKSMERHERNKKRYQRRMARCQKKSKNREKIRKKIAKADAKIANIRHDFCHQATRKIADSESKIIVLEDLKLKNMTRSARGTKESPGKNVAQKSGLNKAILKNGLGKMSVFLEYKLKKNHKYILYINPRHSSQECAVCGHTHPDNRKTQSEFRCLSCKNVDNADKNAAKVLKKRAKNLLTDLGTGLTLSHAMALIASGEPDKSRREALKSPSKHGSKNSGESFAGKGTTKISGSHVRLSETAEFIPR